MKGITQGLCTPSPKVGVFQQMLLLFPRSSSFIQTRGLQFLEGVGSYFSHTLNRSLAERIQDGGVVFLATGIMIVTLVRDLS